ncbi:MAG: PilZ domain-containing protein [Acidobacteriota bacterium]
MNDETPRQPDPRLRVGFTVMIEVEKRQTKASVTLLTETEIVVELLSDKAGPLFEEGGKVRVKYWDNSGIYFCSGEVLRVSGISLAISVYSEPIAMQRRGVARLAFEVPMSIRVTESSHQGLASQKVYQAKTRNISVGGLSFESTLPLKTADVLELQIDLPSQKIGTTGEVVSSAKALKDGENVNAIGVEFFDIPSETRNQLMEFLMEHTTAEDVED